MAFWSNAKIEPKRNFRWTASISGLNNGDFKFLLKKFKKPSFEIKATEHMYLNHKFNYPGRLMWKEIEFTVVNAAAQTSTFNGWQGNIDTTKTFMDLVIKSGYQDPSKVTVDSPLRTVSKSGLTEGLGKIIIRQLGPDGAENAASVQEEWEIWSPIITGMTMSDLDYTNEEINEVTVNLVYDYAILKGTTGNP